MNARSRDQLETDSEMIQIDEDYVNDDHFDKETETGRADMIHIQGRMRLGERRKLTISESKLFKRFNVAADPSLGKHEYKLICTASFLIIFTFAARISLTVWVEKVKSQRPVTVEFAHLIG